MTFRLTPEEMRELSKLKEANKVEDLNKAPKQPHFALLIRRHDSVDVEGDERSRTHPGHGYPAYTHSYSVTDYYAFSAVAPWQRAMELLLKEKPDRQDMLGFEVAKVAQPTMHVSFGFGL